LKKGVAISRDLWYYNQAPGERNKNAGRTSEYGGIAQLGERLNGIQEVSGSIPLISTKNPFPKGNGFFLLQFLGTL
jgi:hypothetical protein